MPTLEETRRRFDADTESFEAEPSKARSAADIDVEALRRRRVSRTREALGSTVSPATSPATSLPRGKPARPEASPVVGARITSKHYRILDDGNDAMLRFGKHAGQLVSALAASSTTRTYLAWMKTTPFPADLMAVVERWLAASDGPSPEEIPF